MARDSPKQKTRGEKMSKKSAGQHLSLDLIEALGGTKVIKLAKGWALAMSTFSPVGSRSSKGMRMCLTVCVCVCV